MKNRETLPIGSLLCIDSRSITQKIVSPVERRYKYLRITTEGSCGSGVAVVMMSNFGNDTAAGGTALQAAKRRPTSCIGGTSWP